MATLLLVVVGCDGGGGGHDDVPEPPGASINALNVTIVDATVADDDRPVVRFFLTGARGERLAAEDVNLRFVIAALTRDGGELRSYVTTIQTSPDTHVSAVQAAAENPANSGGTLQDQGDGLVRYTFGTALPADYDRDATHRLAIYADTTVLEVAYVSNAVHDFVPSGKPVADVRDVVRTETCNTCHDPLQAHGGARRDVRLCVACHSSAITDFATGETTPQIDPDTGNSIGFPEMIHKIHRGENLPSVEAGTPYRIVGFRQTVIDFSHVVFPRDIRNCEACHARATQGHAFATNPSRAACGSCHDDINFASGDNHGGGPQPTDGSCSGCHLPDTGRELDLSVVGSHVIPAHSSQVPGVRFELLGVQSAETGSTVVGPGEHPRVSFRITDASGRAIAPASMNALSFVLGGSTVEYSAQDYDGDGVLVPGDPSSPWTPGAETFRSESAIRNAEGPDGAGVSVYTFAGAVPPNATGTYVIGIEGYKCAVVQGASQRLGGTNCSGTLDANGNGREDPGEVFNEIRDVGPNQVLPFAVTDGAPVTRRQPVTIERCQVCHGELSKDFSVHGGVRNDTKHCPICHNPSNDSLSRQVLADGEAAVTSPVDFKVMIHKIHRGEDLTLPYVLYGRPSGSFPNQTANPIDFSTMLFPGDARDCEACHEPETYVLAPGEGVLQPGVLGSTTRQFMRGGAELTVLDVFTTPPTIAVCTSCHDDVDFTTGANHAAGPATEETCANCHGVGRSLSVERTHLPGLPPEARIQRPNG